MVRDYIIIKLSNQLELDRVKTWNICIIVVEVNSQVDSFINYLYTIIPNNINIDFIKTP